MTTTNEGAIVRRLDAAIDPSAPVPASSGVHDVVRRLTGKAGNIAVTDKQLALLASAALFALVAWPLALTEVPPYQDLPNHLAAVTVIENPKLYPELVFNGFVKTNTALFAWLYFVGKLTGVKLAARLFSLLVLAANALVIPRFVLALTGSRGRMMVATALAWPMVHNWFVSMGMLDFALGVPLSLVLLLAIDKQRRAPSLKHALTVVGLGAATWYAHVFPLLVVHLLVAIEILVQKTWKARASSFRAMALPLLPATIAVLVAIGQHLRHSTGPMTGGYEYSKLLPAWELAYNMWSEWFWAFSHLTITSMVPCVVLFLLGVFRRHESARFFSGWAVLALAVLYCFLPYIVTNWFHVNSRVIPYLWFALLLRVPDRLPKKLFAVLGISAVLYSAGLGADFLRLDRERREFVAGVSAVPEGAKLLPLLFRHKIASDNTRSLLHAWGYYVVEKKTAAPLLFAHSQSFPVMYASPPPIRFNHLVLEGFAASASTPDATCKSMVRGNILVDDCDEIFRTTWNQFYDDALPRYDHLLLWDATPEARAVVPSAYKLTFERGRVAIYERRDGAASND